MPHVAERTDARLSVDAHILGMEHLGKRGGAACVGTKQLELHKQVACHLNASFRYQHRHPLAGQLGRRAAHLRRIRRSLRGLGRKLPVQMQAAHRGRQVCSLEEDQAQLAVLHLLVDGHGVAELLHRHVLQQGERRAVHGCHVAFLRH